MKKFFAVTLALSLCASLFGADSKPIEEVFQRYWGAYVKKDFVRAAADVLPSDLDAAKAALLPVFLEAQSRTDKETQELVTMFFGRTVGKARETLSPQDVFAGLNRIITAGNPQFFEVLKDASLTIVFVRRSDNENAEIHFQVTVQAQSDMDAESLTLKNGRWWVRINEDPKDIAEHFRSILKKT